MFAYNPKAMAWALQEERGSSELSLAELDRIKALIETTEALGRVDALPLEADRKLMRAYFKRAGGDPNWQDEFFTLLREQGLGAEASFAKTAFNLTVVFPSGAGTNTLTVSRERGEFVLDPPSGPLKWFERIDDAVAEIADMYHATKEGGVG